DGRELEPLRAVDGEQRDPRVALDVVGVPAQRRPIEKALEPTPWLLLVVFGRRGGERLDVPDALLEVAGVRAREVLAELRRLDEMRNERKDERRLRRFLRGEVEGVVQGTLVEGSRGARCDAGLGRG